MSYLFALYLYVLAAIPVVHGPELPESAHDSGPTLIISPVNRISNGF
jgi:hypothetical protein